jgi:dynein heavy chain 2
MLPCQQAMLLDAALAFEALFIAPADKKSSTVTVTWDNPRELESYIEQLQTAAERLTTANRRLRKAHQIISDKVATLIHCDLIKQLTRWKQTLVDIRQIVGDTERQGFQAANMRPWLAHWDRQLYKVLEFQYQIGLESLHQQVPDINAELIFKLVLFYLFVISYI